MNKTAITISTTELPINWKFLRNLLIILLILSGIFVPVYTLMHDPDNRRNNSEQNSESNGNGYKSSNDKLDIKIDAEKKMYQLGDHFNKHGRSMGYASKKEYGDAALKFAKDNCKNPKAQIFEGELNYGGTRTGDIQIAISNDNKTVIIDKISGQLIDFYEGIEHRALINLLKIQ